MRDASFEEIQGHYRAAVDHVGFVGRPRGELNGLYYWSLMSRWQAKVGREFAKRLKRAGIRVIQ